MTQTQDPLAIAAEIGRLENLKEQHKLQAYVDDSNANRGGNPAVTDVSGTINALTKEQNRLAKLLEKSEPEAKGEESQTS